MAQAMMTIGEQPADLVDVDSAAYAEGSECRDRSGDRSDCPYGPRDRDERDDWIQWRAGLARRPAGRKAS